VAVHARMHAAAEPRAPAERGEGASQPAASAEAHGGSSSLRMWPVDRRVGALVVGWIIDRLWFFLPLWSLVREGRERDSAAACCGGAWTTNNGRRIGARRTEAGTRQCCPSAGAGCACATLHGVGTCVYVAAGAPRSGIGSALLLGPGRPAGVALKA